MAEPKNRNQRIDALLASVKERVNTAQNQEDLVQAIELIKAFGEPLKYDHTKFYILSALSFICAVAIGGYRQLYYGHLDASTVFMMIALFVVGVAILIYVWRKRSAIGNLADRLFHLDLLFDNGLQEAAIDAENQASSLMCRFHEFNRGNYSQEIRALYKGRYQGKEHSFDYHYYHFHYVDKRTTVTSNGKGGVKTKTVYDHYDRYGFYLPFRLVSNLALISKPVSGLSGRTYKPASNKFNKIYRVVADSEMNAARFLKPMVVIASEEITSTFSELNVEFNENAELCMSFRDSNVLFLPRSVCFNTPDDFIKQVKQNNVLPKLQKALEHIHTLMTYSDSNFRKKDE